MKNRRLAAVLMAVLAVFTFVVPMASAQTTPYLTNIRTGQHPEYDRVVLDMSGLTPDFRVREVSGVAGCASGAPISMPGSSEILAVQVLGAAAHDDNGNPTYTGSQNFATPGLYNVRRVALTCDFEADLGIAVGYANTSSWHRVTQLRDPARLVIDIGRN
ncbi:hypothetical protein ABZX92_10195 [Lentzea sp. NPDC006480]|uniref:AMIN-like domain-containing (lipo)protein n=1 Tax=Lentzea sp. NPDC006480 TaxID=3157176 RepID=UPI0033ADD6A9